MSWTIDSNENNLKIEQKHNNKDKKLKKTLLDMMNEFKSKPDVLRLLGARDNS